MRYKYKYDGYDADNKISLQYIFIIIFVDSASFKGRTTRRDQLDECGRNDPLQRAIF
jgi:hypothetical protein